MMNRPLKVLFGIGNALFWLPERIERVLGLKKHTLCRLAYPGEMILQIAERIEERG